MTASLRRFIRNKLFRIDGSEVTFQKRGFQTTTLAAQSHLEEVGRSFLQGYHATFDLDSLDIIGSSIGQIDRDYRGFAFEGAAMALWLIDSFSLSRRDRWNEFLEGSGRAHRYVLHIGIGWTVARLPWLRLNAHRVAERLDPLLRWLVFDGYGFHQGYFDWRTWLLSPHQKPRLAGYASRAFDQGLGRSLWFVAGGDVIRVGELIEQFEPARRSDLWSGIGVATAYAGKPTVDELEFLMAKAEAHIFHLQQGITFGAEARELGGIQTDHTNLTCMTVCGLSAEDAAELTYAAREQLTTDTFEQPAYEAWRSNIRVMLARGASSCA